MFRVVALGHRAGMIVDRLRAEKNYDHIRFVYCNTNSGLLTEWGKEEDEHILLTGMEKCRKAIHDDNELMAVLVTCLDEECSLKYASDIIYELWGYADYTYCFATLPFFAGGKRDMALNTLNWIYNYSDITVVQDDCKEPYNYFPLDMDKALIRLLDLILRLPQKRLLPKVGHIPFGVWATEKQIWMALNAMYSNNMPEYYEADTISFHRSSDEE